MKRPFVRRDLPAGYQANREGDKEPGTRLLGQDPTFLVLSTISLLLIGITTTLLIGEIHELRNAALLEAPGPSQAFTTASLLRTDPQFTQTTAPALSPTLAPKPEIDRTAPLPEPDQAMLESPSEHLSAAQSQFDRPRQTNVRRRTWFKRSSNGWAKRERVVHANVAFVARRMKPTEDDTSRQLMILKTYLERRRKDARGFHPRKATDAKHQPHKKQILDSPLRTISQALGF